MVAVGLRRRGGESIRLLEALAPRPQGFAGLNSAPGTVRPDSHTPFKAPSPVPGEISIGGSEYTLK